MSLVHEAGRTRSGDVPNSLAPEALWSHAYGRGSTSTNGTSVYAIALALEDRGQPLLAEWPYDAGLPYGTEVPPPSAAAPPWLRGSARQFNLARDRVETELEDVLASGQPALIVVEVTYDFYNVSRSGRVETNTAASVIGSHAITCVGAATVSGERLYLVQNSWGEYWGARGYGWLDHDYLAAFGSEAAALDRLL